MAKAFRRLLGYVSEKKIRISSESFPCLSILCAELMILHKCCVRFNQSKSQNCSFDWSLQTERIRMLRSYQREAMGTVEMLARVHGLLQTPISRRDFSVLQNFVWASILKSFPSFGRSCILTVILINTCITEKAIFDVLL